jgi:hypothetical protein
MNNSSRPERLVKPLVEELIPLFASLCQRVTIAGDIRRGAANISSTSIVAIPHGETRHLLARLDHLVTDGTLKKVMDTSGKTLWNDVQRGFAYQGVPMKVVIADADNWGYQLWLHTGPADCTRYVMAQCRLWKAPYHADAEQRYWWYGERKLHIPTEEEMFRLLGGMPSLVAYNRHMEAYTRYLHIPKGWAKPETLRFADTAEKQPQTMLLF